MSQETWNYAHDWVIENYGFPHDEMEWIDIIDVLLSRDRWISVEEKGPDVDDEGYSDPVLCFCPIERGCGFDGPITMGSTSPEYGWTDYESFSLGVTHWQPLPDLPILTNK